eukprot:11206092-Lingulodinium_polyedra.AAC.1
MKDAAVCSQFCVTPCRQVSSKRHAPHTRGTSASSQVRCARAKALGWARQTMLRGTAPSDATMPGPNG